MPHHAAGADELLLPLTLPEHVELALASPAVRAFAEQRAAQMLPPYNHTAEADLKRSVDELVRMSRQRLTAFLDIVGRDLMCPPADRAAQLLRYLDVAGGLLIAARERLVAAEPAASPPSEDPR